MGPSPRVNTRHIQRWRRSWGWGWAVLAMIVAGCQTPEEQIARYPAPIFNTKPAPALRPRPTPAPPPKPKPTPTGSLKGRTIIVDAGHGGHDPGAKGVGPLQEKKVNLAIATRLAGLLKQRGANVTMTRRGDTFIDLDARAALADRLRVDLFVSVHADSAENASASGATIYIARGAAHSSQRAGGAIVQAMQRHSLECRGIRRAGFRVLVGHSRPAVLVECGFLTNRGDAYRLAQPAQQAKVAAAIADGIAKHLAH